jgi:ankyrin repeat protein
VRGPGQETPLLFAASAGNFDVIKSLLDAGADVLAVNRLKETVLHKCQKISRKIFRNCFNLSTTVNQELNTVNRFGTYSVM